MNFFLILISDLTKLVLPKQCVNAQMLLLCQVLSQLSLVAGHGHIGAEALKSALQRGGLEGWW